VIEVKQLHVHVCVCVCVCVCVVSGGKGIGSGWEILLQSYFVSSTLNLGASSLL